MIESKIVTPLKKSTQLGKFLRNPNEDLRIKIEPSRRGIWVGKTKDALKINISPAKISIDPKNFINIFF